jgi:hypothetical protein
MADIALDKITKQYPDGYEAVKDMDLDIVDRAADDRRARGHHQRRAADR